MTRVRWEDNLFELIRRTSTDLPLDVESSLRRALRVESRNSHAYWAISKMLESARIARERDVPICEDTGALIFYFSVPVGFDTNRLAARTQAAVARATRLGYLRENTLDAISGATYRTNVAHFAPMMHFQQGARKTVDVRLVMKSAVSENAGRQYSLPNADLDADRDIEGVRPMCAGCCLDFAGQRLWAMCRRCLYRGHALCGLHALDLPVSEARGGTLTDARPVETGKSRAERYAKAGHRTDRSWRRNHVAGRQYRLA